jgi:hypothetical protein
MLLLAGFNYFGEDSLYGDILGQERPQQYFCNLNGESIDAYGSTEGNSEHQKQLSASFLADGCNARQQQSFSPRGGPSISQLDTNSRRCL